ncbi:MAG: EF-hand domain-containing protein [Planctomycetaceae bacterium]
MKFTRLFPICVVLAFASSVLADQFPRGDVRDVMLILPGGPLHLRFRVALNGQPLSQRREQFITNLMQRLDANGDGELTADERDASPLFSYGRRKFDNPFLRSLSTHKIVSRDDFERDLARYGSLFSYQEDDAAADSDRKVFDLLDEDGSGRIDAREMRIAVTRVASRDRDRDQCISFEEFGPPPPDPYAALVAANAMTTIEEDPGPPPIHLARSLLATNNITLPRSLLFAYDRNRDKYISPEELHWDPHRITAADSNGDGRLSVAELGRIDQTPVDLDLFVDLAFDGTNATQPLQVLSIDEQRRSPVPRPDLIRLTFDGTTITFAFRQLDPVASALETAQKQFNLLDGDGNGYLDREEVADFARFQRYLFDGMDVDRDNRVYAEEMTKFVAAVAEPPATTCHVNIYNTGQGFFSMLDVSGDGRISIRELRSLEQSMATHERTPGSGIAPAEMGRHLYVEFVRGSRPLFGPGQRLIEQGPTFIERGAIGPAWFQAMDRNLDGDLTYQVGNPMFPPEFLGHPEIAAQMDVDHDGLISYREAEQFERGLNQLAQQHEVTNQTRINQPSE